MFRLLPTPSAAAHVVDGFFGCPAQDLCCLVGLGVTAGDVTTAARHDLVGDVLATGLGKGLDHFQDTAAFASAQVDSVPTRMVLRKFQGREMAIYQVHDMDVVADAGAIRGIVVITKYAKEGALTVGDLGDVRHEVVGDAVGALTNKSAGVGTYRVEVAQADELPLVARVSNIRENFLDVELASAVRIGGASRVVFIQRQVLWISVDGRTGTEDHGAYITGVHGL